MRLQTGTTAPDFTVADIHGKEVALSALRGKRVMLSFYRYASCPFCNLRIHGLSQRAEEFRQRGLEMVAVFQSPSKNILKHAGKQEHAFSIIPDPQCLLYLRYGVETSWFGMLKAFVGRVPEMVTAMARGFLPGSMQGEKSRLPADFIIEGDGTIIATYYGKDIGDHMPVETVEKYLK